MSFMKKSMSKRIAFILALFFISRFGIFAVSYFGYHLFPDYHQSPQYIEEYGYQRIGVPVSITDAHVPNLRDFVKFDSLHYLKIASEGYDTYSLSEPHPPANWAFFPLYPILMKALSFLFPFTDTLTALGISGYLLSNIFAILALYFLFAIARELTGKEGASQKALFYLLLFPSSIYLSLIYTESLFLLLSTLSIYLTLKKRFGWAILAASLSTVTRMPGFVNLLFIAFYLLKENGYSLRKIPLKYYGALILSGLPLLSYFTYMHFLTGDFFAVFKELSMNWGRQTTFPFAVIFNYLSSPTLMSFHGWDLSMAGFIFTVFMLVLYGIFFVKFKKHAAFLVYGLLLVLIPLSSSSIVFTSVIRYYLASFPIFIFMGVWGNKSRIADTAFTVLLLSFQVIYTIGFVNNYFFVV